MLRIMLQEIRMEAIQRSIDHLSKAELNFLASEAHHSRSSPRFHVDISASLHMIGRNSLTAEEKKT